MTLTSRLLVSKYQNKRWILFNTLVGAVDVLDKEGFEELKRIEQGELSNADPQLVQSLRKRGYLFEDKEAEDRLLKNMFEEYRKRLSSGPVKALICPTFSCNLRCSYCFQGNLREKVRGKLDNEGVSQAFSSLDKIIEAEQAPGAQVEISGGEPFLPSSYRTIESILKFAKMRDYPVGFVTNGVNLLHFKPLLDKYRSLIKNVQVTIDGPQTIHDRRRRFTNGRGTFHHIVEGVDLLLKLGIATVMRVNVDLENVTALPELAEFIFDKGWNLKEHFRARLAKVEDHGEVSENASDLSEYSLVERVELVLSGDRYAREAFADTRISRILGQIAKVIEKRYADYKPSFFYCEATSTGMYVFGADGLLYPCGEAAGNPSFAVGRFLPKLEIDQEKLSYWKHQNIVENSECYRCSIASLCGGGCPYQVLRTSDESRTRLCTARKKQAKKYLQLHTWRLN